MADTSNAIDITEHDEYVSEVRTVAAAEYVKFHAENPDATLGDFEDDPDAIDAITGMNEVQSSYYGDADKARAAVARYAFGDDWADFVNWLFSFYEDADAVKDILTDPEQLDSNIRAFLLHTHIAEWTK